MREAAEGLLALVSVAVLAALIVGLVRPRWVKQESRGGVAKIYGLATLACFIVIGVIAEPVETAETGAASEAVEEVPEPTAEDVLRDQLADVLGRSNRDAARLREVSVSPTITTVEWGINDNLTISMASRGARSDAVKILQSVATSDSLSDFVLIRGTASMCDVMGRCQETVVIAARYSKETLQQVNWPNFLTDNVFRIAEEGVNLHPEFR